LSRFELSIGDFVSRTGVTEPTLRMWERRYGFPRPERTESGHRRYSEDQAELVDQVQVLRRVGLSLPVAIARAQAPPDPEAISLFSSLRSLRPELEQRVLSKPVLIAFSHAVEDETLARAEATVLFGCFQREVFYRSAQPRWQELSAAARVAAVFADFEHTAAGGSTPGGYAPAEIPISRRQQVAREWAIVAHGGRSSVCMAARELASSNVHAATPERAFEFVWTVEPEAVQAVARTCVALARRAQPDLAAAAEDQIGLDAASAPGDQVRLTAAVVGRVLSELS
jgi:DICT domain-containing protein